MYIYCDNIKIKAKIVDAFDLTGNISDIAFNVYCDSDFVIYKDLHGEYYYTDNQSCTTAVHIGNTYKDIEELMVEFTQIME